MKNIFYIIFITSFNIIYSNPIVYQFDYEQAKEKDLHKLFDIAKTILFPHNISNLLNYSEKQKITQDYNDCLYKSPNPIYYDERYIKKNIKYKNQNYYWKDSHWTNSIQLENFDKFIKPNKQFINNMYWLLNKFKNPFYNSGKFYYPPKGVREWHTNSYHGGPGWRIYIIIRDSYKGDSGMNIIHPETKKFINIKDKGYATINLFKITNKHNPTWHCIYSKNVNRFSFGFKITDSEVKQLFLI